MLKGYRVLDLSDEKGYLCGKILSDLGAEVIKIEPPGGDSGRNIGPFAKNAPDPDKSLYWFAYNIGKKSITLNIESEDGREIFKKLVTVSDFVIESYTPGYLDSLILGYSEISQINPKIIMVSISPFGQNGPYRDYKAPDIVLMAMGGSMYINGEPEGRPLNFSFPMAYLHAASEAAVGALIASYHRGITGEGQHVDQSAQQSVAVTLHNAVETWDIAKRKIKRNGNLWSVRPPPYVGTKVLFTCKDGYVTFPIMAGLVAARFYPPLIEWMKTDGFCVDAVSNVKWDEIDEANFPKDLQEQFVGLLQQFFPRHTKRELYEGAAQRRILLYPVSSVQDIWEDSQLKFRDFWENIYHPELETVVSYPRPCAKILESEVPERSSPPAIGKNNQEVYEKLIELSPEDLIILKQAGVI